jgi:long-chain acyl-CoA synthetase
MQNRFSNVSDYLLADKDRDRVALSFLGESYTYGQLRLFSERVASSVLGMGGHSGDRVILIGENSLFWVAAYLGIMSTGLICVPLPSGVTRSDLDYILEVTEAKLAFVQDRFARNHAGALAKVRSVTNLETLPSPPSGVTPPPTSPDDLAALFFTSGSTGQPRGVMVSHRNIISNTESIIEYLRLTDSDRIMTVLPFHYCFGASLLHTHLRVGASLVIDARFMYPETVLQRMIDTQCTGFAGVPSHFQVLLRASSVREKSFPHLRYVQQAGGYLAPNFVSELRKALPTTKVFIMYGQTEATARLSFLPPEFLDSKLGSIGKGIPGVSLRVLNNAGEDVCPGEVGEIVASGANVARGYWRAPEESAISFRNGRLYTGDLAEIDEDGFIYIVGRAKDFLKCRGERVSCRQIEEQLLTCADLIEAAVIPVPDDVLGEAVKAFVTPRTPGDTGLRERLESFCRRTMPPQLIPREIVILSALPKNSSGKVLKLSLRTL